MVFRASKRRSSVAGVKLVPDHGDLVSIVQGLQSQGKVVVLTSGTFDILHVGHLRMLRDAKSRGDFLVVAAQSDRCIKKHKCASLPVIPEKERLEMLEAIDCVDYVTTFHDEDMEKLLGKVKPNIYAMGTDYKVSTIPERDIVLSYGGRVIVAGDSKKHSTTEILHRVKALRKLPAIVEAPKTKGKKSKVDEAVEAS